MTITDAQVEAACAAFIGDTWRLLGDTVQESYRDDMRQALQAAAKVVEA